MLEERETLSLLPLGVVVVQGRRQHGIGEETAAERVRGGRLVRSHWEQAAGCVAVTKWLR